MVEQTFSANLLWTVIYDTYSYFEKKNKNVLFVIKEYWLYLYCLFIYCYVNLKRILSFHEVLRYMLRLWSSLCHYFQYSWTLAPRKFFQDKISSIFYLFICRISSFCLKFMKYIIWKLQKIFKYGSQVTDIIMKEYFYKYFIG